MTSLFWYTTCFFGALVWLLGIWMWKHALQLPRLSQLPMPQRDTWPSLCVLVPARNEAHTLQGALSRRMESHYPNVQILVLNDRSDDDTGQIAESMAAQDPRIRVIHIQTLPEGWLGKQHALHTGVQHCNSEWILFSDADVEVAPEVLQQVVHHAEDRGLDVLAVLPTFRPTNVWLGGLYALMFRVLYAVTNVKAIEDPRSRAGMGVGAFTLVRRKTLLESPGFSALRMEVADDVQLGLMLKRCGARCSALNGAGSVSVALYRTVREFVVGAEKNAWAVAANFSLFRGLFIAMTFLFLDLAPWFLAFLAPAPFCYFGWITLLFLFFSSGLALHYNKIPTWYGLFEPFGALLFFLASVRGTLLGWWSGGLFWRNTFYPTSAFLEAKKSSRIHPSLGVNQTPKDTKES